MSRLHSEPHNIARVGWLRAAVLGANDGIVSTASLIVGVAAASAEKPAILLAGSAGLVVLLLPGTMVAAGVIAASLVFLIVLGWLGARAGGAPILNSIVRVVFWGTLAMAVTAGVGSLFNTKVV